MLKSLGVQGTGDELAEAACARGLHAKAVELFGTYLVRFHGSRVVVLPALAASAEADESAEERHVAQVLTAFEAALSQEAKDILGLATAFRQPPSEGRLLQYLASEPVQQLLHGAWGRKYESFEKKGQAWLHEQVQMLVDLRLLERVGLALGASESLEDSVLDAHPLVRRGFESSLGSEEHRHGATARAGFLRGRPDRRPPQSLAEAREEVELFHAYCDAGLWNEADNTLVALDNPKHRFLAPAFERDLLLRFFPEKGGSGGVRTRDLTDLGPPLWEGFGRYRSLAICLELLGQFDEALTVYRSADAALRGDALIALGRLQPLLDQPHAAHPWQMLWQAYRAHAMCLRGQVSTALAVAQATVPMDVYEWVHVFECLLRLDKLSHLDLKSLLYRQPFDTEHRWTALARRRMRADFFRVTTNEATLGAEYREIIEAYDQGGLPYERALTRLSYGRWLLMQENPDEARTMARGALELARRHGMAIMEVDALELLGEEDGKKRAEIGYEGPARP